MSNIEQALKAALAAIELIQCFEAKLTNSQTAHGLPSEKVKRKLRDVISDIEKCEPVGYLCESPDKVARIFVDKPLAIHSHTNTPLYTSPQPRDWVGLSYDEIESLYDGGSWHEFANAISEKLKQLNTKG